MRSSRAREQRANEQFLSLSRERSFGWFHEALVFETSLRPLPPLMFVGFSHRFLPFASNAGISKVLSGASLVVRSNFLSSARHYSASPQPLAFSEDQHRGEQLPMALAERRYEDKALPLGIVHKRLLVRELTGIRPPMRRVLLDCCARASSDKTVVPPEAGVSFDQLVCAHK
jgi:hypothetical protein